MWKASLVVGTVICALFVFAGLPAEKAHAGDWGFSLGHGGIGFHYGDHHGHHGHHYHGHYGHHYYPRYRHYYRPRYYSHHRHYYRPYRSYGGCHYY